DGAGLLGVEVLLKFGRALDIREQRSDRLALAVADSGIRGGLADPNRRIFLSGLRGCPKRRCALPAELENVRIFVMTPGTDQCQGVGALAAIFHPLWIFEAALRAAHFLRSKFVE